MAVSRSVEHKMVIECTLSVSLKTKRFCPKQFSQLPPLPEHMTKRGPYINGTGADDKVVITYEFDKSNLAEAWESIFRQLDVFRGLPGLSLSAQILEKGARLRRRMGWSSFPIVKPSRKERLWIG